jgi:hypothetical protein
MRNIAEYAFSLATTVAAVVLAYFALVYVAR